MEPKRKLFPDTPVKKLLERIKVLEEEIPGERVELPKKEIMSDLFWNLEKWKKKEVNISQRTVELLNLSGILNERDLFNTPLDKLQLIITARGEKKPHLEERNA
jgi:hypothetical protein